MSILLSIKNKTSKLKLGYHCIKIISYKTETCAEPVINLPLELYTEPDTDLPL